MSNVTRNSADNSSATSRTGEKTIRFSPLFNDAFLQIFGRADSEPATLPLINAVLRAASLPEVESIDSITADVALPGGVECKTPRLDVVVLADDGRLIDLEAQRHKVDMGSKSLFYAAKLLVENTSKGRDADYRKAPQVIVVVLLEGTIMFPESDQIVSTCRMHWKSDEVYVDGPDRIMLVVAELDKVRARYNGANIEDVLADESLAWLYLLAAGYKHPEEVDRIMDSFPTIEEFATRYGIAIGDPNLKRAYDKYWESEMEYNSIINEAKRDGFAEGHTEGLAIGRAEGLAEGRSETVKNMADAMRASGIEEAVVQAVIAAAEKQSSPE